MKPSVVLLAAAALLCPQSLAAAAQPADSPADAWWIDEQAFEAAVVATTDLYRREHGAGLVRWNATLAAFAAWYVGNYNCAFRHSGGPYGENMAHGYATPAASVAEWGNERLQYDYGHPGYSSATGHFTQLVWKGTTDVGCARRWCGGAMNWLLACEYWPRGNVLGSFEQNVGRRVR
ncbi:cysteine-rich secretory protein family protein [Hirsutella rhossiliensis]|uniref:Cysteine-rich secretory protein family domain-containing protein n=1 Tax=Hirsutella rhossiliensis TaxID=111463 RepID=A0A9P8MUB7_9HYPO|nr:cysteine-rich secretory protein family domain-containing protein [Hirsutella rhossiliensis]KAH0961380.1 cysteine-rich secretory protein family domain-containing protein [Hirsutella rhossiliensis]